MIKAPLSCGVWLFIGSAWTFGPPGGLQGLAAATQERAQFRHGHVNAAGSIQVRGALVSVIEESGAILTVGAGQQYQTVAAAIEASHNGDTVRVQAGTYVNDFAVINKSITLQGVGGMVNMVATGPIPNGKGIFVINGNVTIDAFSFSGAQVTNRNGAGIRYEGGHLVLNGDYFYNNEEGLLAAPSTIGTITIKNSEFGHNGSGDGQTHNLYVNDIARLLIQDSYIHDAVVGHEVKSRARETIIRNSRIYDGDTGTASYSMDLPNGGKALMENNIIKQGPRSENPIIITIGEEGRVYPETGLVLRRNQILNDLQSPSALGIRNATSETVQIIDNQFYGLTADQIVSGLHTLSNNELLAREPELVTGHPWVKK